MIAQLLLRHQRFSQDMLVLSRQDQQLQIVKRDPTTSPCMIQQIQYRPSPQQVKFMCCLTCFSLGVAFYQKVATIIMWSHSIIHACTHTHMHTHTCMHACTHACMHVSAHTHIHAHTHTHMYAGTHAHMHAHTHAHTYTHTDWSFEVWMMTSFAELYTFIYISLVILVKYLGHNSIWTDSVFLIKS